MADREVLPVLSCQQVLELIPHRAPFRFVDEILEVSESNIVGRYTFREDEYFYAGHFPGNPLTPGVIVLEAMAQVAVVALGIFNLSREVPPDQIQRFTNVFTYNEMEFLHYVRPGDTIITEAERVYWRMKCLKAKAIARLSDGIEVARGVISGLGVRSGGSNEAT